MIEKAEFVKNTEFYFAPSSYRQDNKILIVEKIGRKYVTFSNSTYVYDLQRNYMISKDTGHQGELFRNFSEYERAFETKQLLKTIKETISTNSIRKSEQQLEQVRKLINDFDEKDFSLIRAH